MAGQTSPVGVNESLADAKTLWIGDLAYWCDETWLQSLFAGARAGTWAHISVPDAALWTCYCSAACTACPW